MSLASRLLGLQDITPQALLRLIDAGEVAAVLDVNPLRSWLSARVPGAKHLDPGFFTAKDLPEDKASRLVFYCANTRCTAGPFAARRARAMGYAKAAVMARGIAGWIAAGLPTEAGEGQAAAQSRGHNT